MEPLNPWHSVCARCNLFASTLSAGAGTGVDGLEDLRTANFETILGRIHNHRKLQVQKWLEVGCSQGLFLEAAAARGIEVVGIEPERAMADKARRKGHSVLDGFFPEALPTDEVYDLIIFNDVFEHLPDPRSALIACEERLTWNGVLIINLPSSNGALFRISRLLWRLGWSGPYERLWQKDFPSPHTFYFNEANLQRLVERTTRLRMVDSHRLKSLHRKGLRARVRATYPGLAGEFITFGVWCVSHILPALPADICVLHFQNNARDSRGLD